MLFSHISDTHLGLVQYGSEERAQDVYDAFNQAIDTSINDHVDFVIFADVSALNFVFMPMYANKGITLKSKLSDIKISSSSTFLLSK